MLGFSDYFLFVSVVFASSKGFKVQIKKKISEEIQDIDMTRVMFSLIHISL